MKLKRRSKSGSGAISVLERDWMFWCTALALLVTMTVGCSTLKRWGYEGFDRDEWQQPQRVISSLGIQPGDHIADLGSGSGYFTFRFAEVVAPMGTVYAVDVDADMNEYLEARAREEEQENVEVILAEYQDPLLPESSVDLIFTCNTYHHIEDRASYFAKAQRYLRPNGRVAIVDYNGKGWLEKLLGHWVSREEITSEMSKAGYRLVSEFRFLQRQHFLIFSTRAE